MEFSDQMVENVARRLDRGGGREEDSLLEVVEYLK